MTPVMVTVAEQPSWAQSQQPSAEERDTEIIQVIQLMEQGFQLQQQGKSQESVEVWQKVLAISQQAQLKEIEALGWLQIGSNYEDLGKMQAALEAYQQALPIFREAENQGGEAITLNNLGLAYKQISKLQQAIDYLGQALTIYRELQDPVGEATALNNLAEVYYSLGKPQLEIEYYEQALPLLQEVHNRHKKAITLNNLGLAYNNIGQPQQAIKYYQQALPIAREIEDRTGEATTLRNLGEAYRTIGKTQQVVEYHEQALPIYKALRDGIGEASTLVYLGQAYDTIGQPQQAIEYYQQALSIYRAMGDKGGEADALNGLGLTYNNIGQPQWAIKYMEQALPIYREVNDKRQEGILLNNLGLAYKQIGQLQQTTEHSVWLVFYAKSILFYVQSLSISQELKYQELEAVTLNNLGPIYNMTNQPQLALESYGKALAIFRKVQNRELEGVTLNNLGFTYMKIGQLQLALELFEQALPIIRAVQHRRGEAQTLSNMAFVYRDTNQPEKAIEHWTQSLEITLNLRSNLKQEHRKTFIESNDAAAIALTSFLIEQNEPKEAFTWINRVTTYELADYTRLLGAKVENPQAQALIDQYNQRSQQIESLRRQLQLDLSDDQLSRRINDLQTENIQLGEQIAQQYPKAADLFETPLIDIDELQATIPPGTVVLQPVPLTNITNVPNTLALFLLTRDSFQVVQTSLDAQKFNQLVQRYPQQLENRHKDSLTTSRDLYHILIRPIEDQLNAYNPEHLSIIATGQLRYIPFESLNDRETKQFLIEKYPINYLTRLSPTPSNPQTRNNSRRLLAFGNPKPDTPLDLPGTEAEVNTITRLFRNSQRYLHQSATLDQFKTQAPKFPFLHLATHGCFQDQPCQFEAQEDGKTYTATLAANTILFADRQWPIQDAALLGLTDTRLIALSACQTAREADLEGNSISGVAYLFERAGAQAVMASLWQAEDRYTQELMSDFYQYIMEGMTQAQALRQAKLNQLKHHPHIWSPFILIGDAQSYPLPETGFLSPVRTPVFALIAGSILLICGFWWLKRGR